MKRSVGPREKQTNKQTDRQTDNKKEDKDHYHGFQTDLFHYLPYSMKVNNSCDHSWVLIEPYSPINNVRKYTFI